MLLLLLCVCVRVCGGMGWGECSESLFFFIVVLNVLSIVGIVLLGKRGLVSWL